MQDTKNSIKETLLARIQKNELTMRPKAYFFAQIATLIIVSAGILLISISLLNFILFSLRVNNHDSLLGFGSRGIMLFLSVFPWTFFVIDIALIVFLEWLLRRFRFASRIPVLYMLSGIFVATISFGLLIDRETSFNDDFMRQADAHHLPSPIEAYFIQAHHLLPLGSGMCKCTITAINGTVLSADDIDLSTTTHLTILLPEGSASSTSWLSVGDTVFIAGDRDGNTIEAFGIHKSGSGTTTRLQGNHQ
jgi:hypothetical protein